MGRTPCCAKVGLNRGAWTAVEDKILAEYIQVHGEGRWKQLPKNAGLKRCGKSCRLRWLNYLRPDIKRGNIGEDEEDLIVRLHKLLGNRWSLIAGRIPGRTDNEIKNYWNTNLSKKASSSPSLSPATTTKNLNKSSLFNKPENISSSKNTMPMANGSNSSTQVFRTRATKCSKVVIQTPPPPPPPPPQASTSTNNIIHSHEHGEGFGVDSLFNDLPMIPDDIDDLNLGDFCLDDFLINNGEFDGNQSSIIINTDSEKDRASETVHRACDQHEFRSLMMSRQSCTNVGSDVNYEHDQLCPMFIDSYDNNWDL